jgi:rhamnogalacturonyl hydrolase YesR
LFRLGASLSVETSVARPLPERVRAAGHASLAYWFYRWDWGEAVALDGLLAAGRRFGIPAFTDAVVNDVSDWVAAERGQDPNVLGPCVALLDLLESGSLRRDLVPEAWGLLRSVVDRVVATGDVVGGFAPESDGRRLFVDSLYGVPELLVRIGDATGDARLPAIAAELAIGHCTALQREDGLFAHVVDLDTPAAERIPWGRGNGWAVLGLTRLIVALGPVRVPGDLQRRYDRLAAALRDHQDPGGAWRNLVDEPASYPESSTTAMAAAALTEALAAGLLPEEYRPVADGAWRYVAYRIDANGHLTGVSYRPGVNSDRNRYEHTPVTGSYPWGQGPYLLAATLRAEEDT